MRVCNKDIGENHKKKVTIIIPFYNHIETTKMCLQSIIKCTSAQLRYRYEIVVVDDNSNEEYSFEHKKSIFPLNIIRNQTNLGFAGSCNRGAIEAGANYLVFLNNDTITLDGWLDELIKPFETDSQVGVVGSKLLYSDNTIQHAGVVFDDTNMPFHIYHRFQSSFFGVNQTREYQAVTGACMAIDRELFFSLGGFDENYLNGLEDIDLCLKVRNIGKKVLYNPKSTLYHLEGQTRKVDLQKQKHNMDLFLTKWGKTKLTDYLDYYRIDLIDENLPSRIRNLKMEMSSPNRPLLGIWGAGRLGCNMASLLSFIGMKPDFFVDGDNQKWGQKIDEYPIYAPDYIKELKAGGKRLFLIIASLWFRQIEEQLVEFGLQPGVEYSANSIF